MGAPDRAVASEELDERTRTSNSVNRNQTYGLLSLGGFALCLAGAALATRLLHGAVPAAHLFCVRALVWLAWLTPWAVRRRRDLKTYPGFWVSAAAVFGTACLFGYVQAMTLVPLPLGTTLLYGSISPFVLMLDWLLLARRPRGVDLLLMLGASGGMAVIALPEGAYAVSSVSPAGVAGALGCALFLALYFMSVQRSGAEPNLLNFFYALALLAVGAPLSVAHPSRLSGHLLWLCVVYGICTLIGQSLAVVGSQQLGAAAAGSSSCAIPIIATFLGWIVLGEKVSYLEFAGLLVVVGCAGRVSLNMGARNQGAPAPFRWQRSAVR